MAGFKSKRCYERMIFVGGLARYTASLPPATSDRFT
jgi:hypothetical protein